MDELKNIGIQTLETNGVLGQVRAQLRSCVFKVIDNQDQVESKKSNFHWENPHARKLRDNKSSTLAAELIREFLEFYRLDYTLAIYGPEVNLKGKTEDKDGLARRAGFSTGAAKDKPILLQMLEKFMSGDMGSAPSAGYQQHQLSSKPLVEPLSLGSLPP